MAYIVPPQRTYKERKVMRRMKAFLWRQWSMAFALLGMGSFVLYGATLSVWPLVVCIIFGGLTLVAGVGALVYLFVETPQEVTLRIYDRHYPFVIHLNGKESGVPSNNRWSGS